MRLDVTLPEDGRYTVELHNSHWTPAPAGTFLTTGLLPVDAGAWIPQVNSTPALGALQTVRWTLEGTAGQRVLLAAQRTDSCGWNYSLALRRPNGVVIARDTGQFDDDARLDVTMPEDGRYTVELSNDTWLQLPAGTFSITGLPPVDAGPSRTSTRERQRLAPSSSRSGPSTAPPPAVAYRRHEPEDQQLLRNHGAPSERRSSRLALRPVEPNIGGHPSRGRAIHRGNAKRLLATSSSRHLPDRHRAATRGRRSLETVDIVRAWALGPLQTARWTLDGPRLN